MSDFQDGYNFFAKNAASCHASVQGEAYVNSVSHEIDELQRNLNSMAGYHTDISQLKGDAAEFWHSGTFNIDAAVKGSQHRTVVDRSHDFASPDISSNFDYEAGLKYYRNAQESAKQQAKTYWERYNQYRSEHPDCTYEQYLSDRGIPLDVDKNASVYTGQYRIIPADQLHDAEEFLKRQIAKESAARPELAQRYQDTLDMLRDRIKDAEGNSSIPLTREEAELLARTAKEGGFNPSDFGLTTENLITSDYIMGQALQAGVNAAIISGVMALAPDVISAIKQLAKEGEIDPEQIKRMGLNALTATGEGFLRGTISAAVTTSCKAGLWGRAAKAVDPTAVASVTVIAIDALKGAFAVATGRETERELRENLRKELYVASCSYILGTAASGIPVVGFMLGSFVGSMIGEATYTVNYKHLKENFQCVNSNLTVYMEQLKSIDFVSYEKQMVSLSGIIDDLAAGKECTNAMYQYLESVGSNLQFHDFEEFDEKMQDDNFVLEI